MKMCMVKLKSLKHGVGKYLPGVKKIAVGKGSWTCSMIPGWGGTSMHVEPVEMRRTCDQDYRGSHLIAALSRVSHRANFADEK